MFRFIAQLFDPAPVKLHRRLLKECKRRHQRYMQCDPLVRELRGAPKAVEELEAMNAEQLSDAIQLYKNADSVEPSVGRERDIRASLAVPNAVASASYVSPRQSVEVTWSRPWSTFETEDARQFLFVRLLNNYGLVDAFEARQICIGLICVTNNFSKHYRWAEPPGPSRGYESAREFGDREWIDGVGKIGFNTRNGINLIFQREMERLKAKPLKPFFRLQREYLSGQQPAS
ncbi:hypothetical protein [Bradyrhizobium stylosanthis]|uniref:hypothetical protein n=1 Tax=Bradyrhizobium stylosanthis TaxID=1803665 RepID=UPI000AA419B8|nr:hypothetical protein [Bradyrhizobium stylosanthis]